MTYLFHESGPLRPGALMGILGGGQLGRMTAMAAKQMGYRIAVLDPDPDSPAMQIADRKFVAKYTDRDAARDLARACDVVTYEFENINAETAEAVADLKQLLPSDGVLRITQHRVREKEAMRASGVATAPFRPITSQSELREAVSEIGLPAVMKTATSGYDGKGQVVIQEESQVAAAYEQLRRLSPMHIYERYVPFKMEISVIVGRDVSGRRLAFPASENIHADSILDVSIAPARVGQAVADDARGLAYGIAEHLGLVGLLAVEMFVTEDDELLVNELAPRPHNSGHYTIDACRTSQFQQLARIMAGLPMGSVEMPRPAVMVNLLGDVWLDSDAEPDWAGALSLPGVSLHLYGKKEPRRGRKMGHLTAVAADVEVALERSLEARERAGRRPKV
jgi:5-(carboxyamino)imidazole ribonucleotide synthase